MKDLPYFAEKALRALEGAIVAGTLEVMTPEGKQYCFAGEHPGPSATIHVHDWRTVGATLAEGDIGLGNAYMAGWWDSPDLEALLSVFMINMDRLGRMAWGSRLHRVKSTLLEWFVRRNSMKGAQRNIMAHYDLGNEFYALWLDPTMTYSSAVFSSPGVELETAQRAKYARILERLGDGRGEVLEIGCGWGGFLDAASAEGRKATGLTISPEQQSYAANRVEGRADVILQDYRVSSGRYPAIVSIEMFEAVGERYWPVFFKTLRERLTDNGSAIVQTISISEQLFPTYRTCSDYIRHHIFPGGMLPSLSRFRGESERAGLAVRDVFSFGQDYARTCREWLVRFDRATPDIRALGHDDRFIRGWRLYLAMCAGAFALGRTDVHQIELARV